MSTFGIAFDTNNAAFRRDDGTLDTTEVARILRSVADSIETDATLSRAYIRDLNGNTVGSFNIDESGSQ